jgi:hypothetical protein
MDGIDIPIITGIIGDYDEQVLLLVLRAGVTALSVRSLPRTERTSEEVAKANA